MITALMYIFSLRTKLVPGMIVLLFASAPTFAATIESEALAHLEKIRSIKAGVDSKTIEQYNKQMDDAWKFFDANKKTSLPILREQLEKEIKRQSPNNLILLDIGYYLHRQDARPDKDLAKQAIFGLDVKAEIVRANLQQLFYFAHMVAADRDPRILKLIDNAFLQQKSFVFVPQHAMKLDETLTCVFLFGVYGNGAEDYLRSLLSDRKLANRVIEILIWVGSPASVGDVQAAMMANREFETFARATSFMMMMGGVKGRSTMLEVNPKDLDLKSREYFQKIRKDIEGTNFEVISKQFSAFPGNSKLSDDALKTRLSIMSKNYGKDMDTNPQAIINSSLSKEFLISELTRIRFRMFHRISDEALSDVKITNALINALDYKNDR